MHAATSPYTQRVPNETLLEIFSCSADISPHLTLTLSHVCLLWRRLTIATPELWSHIVVTDNSAPISDMAVVNNLNDTSATFPFVALYLERSQPKPLDMTVNLPSDGPKFTIEHAPAFSCLLDDHHRRLRSFTVKTFSHQMYTYLIEQLGLRPMPQLVKWDVSLTSSPIGRDGRAESIDDIHYHTPVIFTTNPASLYPALQCVRLTSLSCFIHNPFVELPPTVTELSISHIPLVSRPFVSQLRAILRSVRGSLETLILTGCLPVLEHPFAGFADIPKGVIVMENVRTLKLGYTRPQELVDLFHGEGLVFPNVTRFSLGDMDRTFLSKRGQGSVIENALDKIIACVSLDKVDDARILSVRWPIGDDGSLETRFRGAFKLLRDRDVEMADMTS